MDLPKDSSTSLNGWLDIFEKARDDNQLKDRIARNYAHWRDRINKTVRKKKFQFEAD